MNEQHQQLIRLVEETAGESFRTAFAYEPADWEALYVRSDLATPDLQSAVPALVTRTRSREPLVREEDYPSLGSQRAAVSLHEEAVLIHFFEGDESGVVITLDTDVAGNLSQFVAACETVLSESQRRQ